jgi:hypothetical protein
VKFTKMNVTGQLDPKGAEKLATRIGVSYIIAATAALLTSAAALVYAIRWW